MGGRAKLICATCQRSQWVDADTKVDGISIGPWWTEVRHHSCAECYAHTCWQPVAGTVCFKDKDHPGDHLPWKESYGDVVEGAEPIADLWTRP